MGKRRHRIPYRRVGEMQVIISRLQRKVAKEEKEGGNKNKHTAPHHPQHVLTGERRRGGL